MGAVEYTNCIYAERWDPSKYLGYDTKQSNGEASVMLELTKNVEYFFIAIALRPTLAWSDST